jgi:hypothetical protein
MNRIAWKIAANQAAQIIRNELQRASNRGLELRWQPIRAALTILELGPAMRTKRKPLF